MGCNKNKLYKTLGYQSRGILNFKFQKKSQELVTSPHFEVNHDFS